MSLNTKVRTIRPHDTTEGMKLPGEVYSRTQEDAEYLAAIGVVDIVGRAAAATKRTGKATKLKAFSPS